MPKSSNGTSVVLSSSLSSRLSNDGLFAQLVGLMEVEELLRLRKRCQMRGKIMLAAILTVLIEGREEAN